MKRLVLQLQKCLLLTALVAAASCSHQEKATVQPPMRVKAMPVVTTEITGSSTYSGTVEESSGVALSFLVAGSLQQLYVSEGDRVKAGQVIGQLDASDLQHSYDIARAATAQARDAYDRMKILHDSNSLPDMQWVEVQNTLHQAESAEAIAKKALADTRLRAPIDGYVAEKLASVGTAVGPGIPVVRIVAINPVKVSISVPENEIGSFEGGQKAAVKVGAIGGRTLEGVVAEKGVSANPLSRAYEIKIRVDNPTGELLPGMIADVTVEREHPMKAVVLPPQSVLLDADNHNFVWLARNGRAIKHNVEVNGITDRGIVISGGLSSADSVIIEGQQKVSNMQQIAVLGADTRTSTITHNASKH